MGKLFENKEKTNNYEMRRAGEMGKVDNFEDMPLS